MRSRALLAIGTLVSTHMGCLPNPESADAIKSGQATDVGEPEVAPFQPIYRLPDINLPAGECAGAAYRHGSLCESKSQVDHIVTLRVKTVEPVIYPAWLPLCMREPWVFVDENECGAAVAVGLRVTGNVEHVLYGGFVVGDQLTVSVGADKFWHWERVPYAESATTYEWLGSEDTPPEVSGIFPGMLIGMPLIEVPDDETTILNPVSVWFTLDEENRVVPHIDLAILEDSCVRSRFARHAAGLSLDEIAAVEACPLEHPLDKVQPSPFPSGRWSATCNSGSVYLEFYGLPEVCEQGESG